MTIVKAQHHKQMRPWQVLLTCWILNFAAARRVFEDLLILNVLRTLDFVFFHHFAAKNSHCRGYTNDSWHDRFALLSRVMPGQRNKLSKLFKTSKGLIVPRTCLLSWEKETQSFLLTFREAHKSIRFVSRIMSCIFLQFSWARDLPYRRSDYSLDCEERHVRLL